MLAYRYDLETGAYLNDSVDVDRLVEGLTDQVPPFVPDPKVRQQFFRDGKWVLDLKPKPLPGQPGGRLLTDEEVDRVNAGEKILE